MYSLYMDIKAKHAENQEKMTRYWGRETARGYENDIQGFNNGWLYGKTSYKQYGRLIQPTTDSGL